MPIFIIIIPSFALLLLLLLLYCGWTLEWYCHLFRLVACSSTGALPRLSANKNVTSQEDKTHCVVMGNLSYAKQPPPVVFVQTVEHADGNPYSKTNTVSILDLHEWSACSKEFQKRGFKVIRFTAEEIADLEYRRKSLMSIHTPVVGSRLTIKTCLRHLSVLSESESLPELRDYPVALRSFLKRRVKETTFEEVKELYDSVPNFKAFIKPRGSEYVKMWTGCVINSKDDLWKLTNVEDSTPVYVSEPVAFLAEYRCYVICGSLKAVSCYVGDERSTNRSKDFTLPYAALKAKVDNSPTPSST